MLTEHEMSRAGDLHISRISNANGAPPNRNPRGKPFGTDGHRGGRPPGSRNKATLLGEALLDGELDNVIRRTIDHAVAGHPTAMRLVVERLVPRRGRRAPFELPPIDTIADALAAMKRIPALVADGELDPREGAAMVAMLDQTYRTLQDAQNNAEAAALVRGLRFGRPAPAPAAEPPPVRDAAREPAPETAAEAPTEAATEPATEAATEAAWEEPPAAAPDEVVTSVADADAIELPSSYMDGDGPERAGRELGLDPCAHGTLAVFENPDLVAPRLISWKRNRGAAGTS